MRICNDCGQKVGNEVENCTKCGSTDLEVFIESKPRDNKKLLVGVAIGIILIAIISVATHFGNVKTYKNNLASANSEINDLNYNDAASYLDAALKYKKTSDIRIKRDRVLKLAGLTEKMDAAFKEENYSKAYDNLRLFRAVNKSNDFLFMQSDKVKSDLFGKLIGEINTKLSEEDFSSAYQASLVANSIQPNDKDVIGMMKTSKTKLLNDLVKSAQSLYAEKSYSEALDKIKEASAVDPKNTYVSGLVVKYNKAKIADDARQAREEAIRKREAAAAAAEEATWNTDSASGVKWKWMKHNEFSCDYSGSSCWGIKLKSSTGCPGGIYAEINIFDSSGAQIDYSNDSLSSLSAYTIGKMLFHTFRDDASTGRISEISCHD